MRVAVPVSAGDGAQRAGRAVHELRQAGGLDRSTLLVVLPTGSGWVNPAAVDVVELQTSGGVATVSVQYDDRPSYRPSSPEGGEGRGAGAAVARPAPGGLSAGRGTEQWTRCGWRPPTRTDPLATVAPVDGTAQVLLVAVAALGALALLARAVLVRGEPWWVGWPPALAALGLVLCVAAGVPRPATVAAVLLLVVGLVLQVAWSYRKGRYLEDDVASLWRTVRRRPAPTRRRHRAPGDD